MRIIAVLGLVLAGFVVVAQASQNRECGQASWYAIENTTASGEMMDPSQLTAAHPSHAFGTRLNVINQENGKSVIVRINDRGPFTKKRIIDVSKAAAEELDFISDGHVEVCLLKVE